MLFQKDQNINLFRYERRTKLWWLEDYHLKLWQKLHNYLRWYQHGPLQDNTCCILFMSSERQVTVLPFFRNTPIEQTNSHPPDIVPSTRQTSIHQTFSHPPDLLPSTRHTPINQTYSHPPDILPDTKYIYYHWMVLFNIVSLQMCIAMYPLCITSTIQPAK